MGEWHDGYRLGGLSVFNPWSVINYLASGQAGGVHWANTASNDVAGDAARSADEDMLEQLHTLLGTGGHIVSARALLRAFLSRALFGFPASATQLRSSAGLGFHG